MTATETATCQNCGWKGPVDDTKELRDVFDRVHPGDVMPVGECPEPGCGAAAMLDEDDQDDALRPAPAALMPGLDRLRHSLPAGEIPGPAGADLREPARDARAALTADNIVQPVCNTCGGTDVRIDAWAAWDLPAQRWELHSTYDAHAICGDCGGGCSYSMKPAGERA